MTTRSAMRVRITGDILRSDLTTEVVDAINTAIDFYQADRFYFNETRGTTFATVAGQSRYSSSDSADIPNFVKLDDVFLVDGSSNVYPLDRGEATELEWLLGNGASTGRPIEYAWFDQSFWFYPIPDQAYTIRPMGVIKKAAPADDLEAGNVWMVEAFELIRCAAEVYIHGHITYDAEAMQAAAGGEMRAKKRLIAETSRKTVSGRIIPTTF